ncbi:MAG: alpha/beta hydrolase [Oscillospiraceae bacterium]|nr:alpha/beta hydrolase [Oscillospiraceae bacterium]
MSDISLCYTKQGAGPPLLLLHGNGEDGSYFIHQMEYFSRRYTVYAVDTRGHGQSPRGTAPFTIAQFAEDLSEFMDEQGILRAAILGFSDGGNIALTFALAHPGRVSRLILNGANLDPSGVTPQVQIPIVLGYKIASLFAGKSPKAKAHAEMLSLMVNEPHIDPEELKKLRARTLVIVGTKDMIKDEHTLLIARSLPRSQLEIIAGDHFIAAKNPHAFNRAVDRFLSEP